MSSLDGEYHLIIIMRWWVSSVIKRSWDGEYPLSSWDHGMVSIISSLSWDGEYRLSHHEIMGWWVSSVIMGWWVSYHNYHEMVSIISVIMRWWGWWASSHDYHEMVSILSGIMSPWDGEYHLIIIMRWWVSFQSSWDHYMANIISVIIGWLISSHCHNEIMGWSVAVR
jgi:hypothetical protein